MNSNYHYINSISAIHFDEVNGRQGWYWHDRYEHDNDFKGSYNTEEEALEAGREYRKDLIKTNFKGKLIKL